MLDERELIGRLEAADADELADLVARPDTDEERVLRLYLGSRLYQRLHSLALRRELQRKGSGQHKRGNVVIVPGIFGCELSSFDRRGQKERVWLSARSVAAGHFPWLRLDPSGRAELDMDHPIQATGIIKRQYGELILTLAEQWNAHVFWYDWRKDFRIAAAQLQARVNTWFAENEPVHFVAHAEGGLVVRSYIAHYEESWKSHQPGKLLMIGTPNCGLYSAIQALTGQLEMIQWLDLLDSLHDEVDIRTVVNSFPSLYQLLPAPWLNGGLENLYEVTTYGENAGVSAEHLKSAQSHHEKLHAAVDPKRMIYIGGNNQPTLTGVHVAALKQNPRPELCQLYQIGLDGDGRVPHKLGVLYDAQGEHIPAYFLNANFGELHTHPAVLSALNDLLEQDLVQGDWRRIGEPYGLIATRPVEESGQAKANPPATNAIWQELEQARLDSRKSFENLMRRMPVRSLANQPAYLYTIEDSAIEENLTRHLALVNRGHELRPGNPLARFDPPTIQVNVVCCGITDVDQLAGVGSPVDAIGVGHYSGGKPETAMRTIDLMISSALTHGTQPAEADCVLYQFTQRGTIQSQLAQTFLLNDPSPRGKDLDRVIAIAGMGAPGRFGAPELTVLARELCWTVGRIGKKHLATVLIGAGNGNLSITEAVAAWLRGLKFALTGIDKDRQPLLTEITFVEENPMKVLEIDRAIKQEINHYNAEQRMLIHYTLLDEAGGLDQQIAAWQEQQRRKSVQVDEAGVNVDRELAPTRITVSLDGETYHFGAITDSASIPNREIPLDPDLVRRANDELAAEIDPHQQLLLGQFMERLLIPADLRTDLAGSAPIVMMLDATTARIHWELMGQTTVMTATEETQANDDLYKNFWATSRGFTRQLRTGFAPPPEPPPPNNRILRVLVVADPAADAHLPGAEEEGILVADLFESFNLVHATSPNRVEVVRLFGPSEATRTAVLRQLMMRTYDVLHFAGHCVYDPDDPANSGWIFTGGQRLTSYEFDRIDRVPKFIFSNACESGITPIRSEQRTVELAPSFAEIFFARGVSNLVCTAWPVDDRAAREFALTLYAKLLGMARSETAPEQKRVATRINYTAATGGPQPMYRAMQAARCTIANPALYDIRTWGAYQHYGNPYFQLFDRASMRPVTATTRTGVAAASAPPDQTDTAATNPIPFSNGATAATALPAATPSRGANKKQKTPVVNS
ncbi:MAG: CHAT domain-containing protein [Caldilineaceae bacterium]